MANTVPPTPPLVHQFIEQLIQQGFSGECEVSYPERLMAATDNSIYQLLPEACLYPHHRDDVIQIMRLLGQPIFQALSVTARGGGTGTNGQSLTAGIVVDLSRHFRKILHIDAERRQVRVESGVVKDQLNAALKPYGLFFAPELSTSNRATIGGMVNTDASGQGSCVYGKTRDHVLALETVCIGGEVLQSTPIRLDEWETVLTDLPMSYQNILTQLRQIIEPRRAQIQTTFPKLNRCLTGYDLVHALTDDFLDINALLCGSEGTLGLITEATLNLLPLPKFTTLVNVGYADFMQALEDTPALMQSTCSPTSIEILDGTVIALAKQDFVWQSVATYFESDESIAGMILIEFNADDETSLASTVTQFCHELRQDQSGRRRSISVAEGREAVNKIYAMRKRAVGLLGNVQGERRPLPFVEDTAVPPQHLADFIRQFRAILDQHQLQYGMFGHADAGVLHVRPALDMKQFHDQTLIRRISDQVAALCQQYGGVLWGEHGKGMRSDYAPQYFGELYPVLQQIKAIFDPAGQLNPGKIVALPQGKPLYRIDNVPLRGEFDRQISQENWQLYQEAVFCNGNGACFNYDKNDPMCPSFKATGQRMYSPKGRATLLKDWLRHVPDQTVAHTRFLSIRQQIVLQLKLRWQKWRQPSEAASTTQHLLESALEESLSACLSCKSCTTQCPIKIDVPRFKSKFLYSYYQSHCRAWRDFLLGSSESLAPFMARFSKAIHYLFSLGMMKRFWQKIGIVDLPIAKNDPRLKPYLLHKRPETLSEKTVIIIPDAFSRYFDSDVLYHALQVIEKLGFNPVVAPYIQSGKAWHVLGFLPQFTTAAERQITQVQALAHYGRPLIVIEPAVNLLYRQEYKESVATLPSVELLQEWLVKVIPSSPKRVQKSVSDHYHLLSHCSEKTQLPQAVLAWQTIFTQLGVTLTPVNTGCCGMSGLFGHLSEQQSLSRQIYADSWENVINQYDSQSLLATGYSCRTQVARFSAVQLSHPIVAMDALLS